MIHENEIVMLILGLGVFIFMLGNMARLKRLHHSKVLTTGFYLLFGGWILTVLEGFFWGGVLNVLEHTCYAAGTSFLCAWFWKIFVKPEGVG